MGWINNASWIRLFLWYLMSFFDDFLKMSMLLKNYQKWHNFGKKSKEMTFSLQPNKPAANQVISWFNNWRQITTTLVLQNKCIGLLRLNFLKFLYCIYLEYYQYFFLMFHISFFYPKKISSRNGSCWRDLR